MTGVDVKESTKLESSSVVEVATSWQGSVLDVRQLGAGRARRPERFEIGEEPSCDRWVPSESIGGRSRARIVEARPGGAVVSVPAAATAALRRAGAEPRAPETVTGPAEVPLVAGLEVELRVSELTFLVRRTDPGRIERGAVPVDRSAAAFGGISLFAHATFIALIYLVPANPSWISIDSAYEGNRFVSYLVAPPELPEPIVPEILQRDEPSSETEASGDAHEGPSGQAGREDAPVRQTRAGFKNRGFERVQLGREQARDLAKNSGILAFLRSEAPVSPFGSVANGMDAEDALGHLLGREVGAAFGNGGLGPIGTGRGGGGIDGGVGFGRLRTIGDSVGGGTGPGTCYGCGQSKLASRRARGVPTVEPGVASTSGALAPEVIRRHIRQHTNAIRFCYETGLAQRPDLSGRVAIRFVIGQDGGVVNSAVASSTLESPTVGACVAQAIGRITFPPPGGGVVVVTYPFTFVHD